MRVEFAGFVGAEGEVAGLCVVVWVVSELCSQSRCRFRCQGRAGLGGGAGVLQVSVWSSQVGLVACYVVPKSTYRLLPVLCPYLYPSGVFVIVGFLLGSFVRAK